MSISANGVFHFTDKGSLINILRNDFIPYYSMESVISDELELAIPMVSFCDIPLTQTLEHISEYGNYAIGLSKKWVFRNNLNPVLYHVKNSALDQAMYKLFKSTFLQAKNDNGFQPKDIPKVKSLFYYIYYSKPFEGSNWDKKTRCFKDEDRCLYNEREWRYIPEESSDSTVNFLFKETFLNDELLMKHNEKLENNKLFFEPEDIIYIILKNDEEILDMINDLYVIKGKYSAEQKKKLTTRIITIEQIMNDF